MATKKVTTTTKKNTPSQKHASEPNYKSTYDQHRKMKKQIAAVIMFTAGVLIGAIVLIKGENVWTWIHNFFYGIFGLSAIILPIALIYIAVMATLDKPIGDIKHKIWQTGVLMALFCGLFEICIKTPYVGDNFVDVLGNLFENGVLLKGGGLFSAILGWPLFAACGKAGSITIIILLLFAFIMLLSGATLIGFFKGVAKPVKKMSDSYVQKREDIEKKRQTKFDIDVDLGPEVLPNHPVYSPKPTPQELQQIEKQKNEELKQNQKGKSFDIDDNPIDELINQAISDGSKKKKQEPIPIMDISEQTKLYTDNNNVISQYIYPPISLLKLPKESVNNNVSDELKANAALLVDTLKSFGVETRIINISRGPTVTRYELQPSAGVKISKITGLSDDIALNLATAGVRIEAPIPNKAAVGIEVPNKNTDIVTVREIVDSKEFDSAKSDLTMALGRDIAGNVMVADISKMPHMLIAGSTGSGKSVCINSIIISLLYKSSPSDVRFLMIDPKVVELGVYNGIPHLLVPVVTDPRKAAGALGWAVTEMLKRYRLFADSNVRDLTGYNLLASTNDEMDPLPQIVIIIDELADLMMAAPNEVEDSICRLAQMARAAGMHLIIATQRPSVDVITGVIKANIPSRIAFAVSSQVDSRTILDGAGAEKLLGRGDMLFYPVGIPKPIRVQGCFVSDKEVEHVVEFVKNKEKVIYDDEIIQEIEKQAVKEKVDSGSDTGSDDDSDVLLNDAVTVVIEAGQASTSYLQRKLKVGYARAARIIDEMEAKGIVGPFEGSKPRQINITRQQWIEMNMNNEE